MSDIAHEIIEYRNITSYLELPSDDVAVLAKCVESAFGGGVTEEDAKDHMAGDQLLIARRALDGGIVGFSASTVRSPQEMLQDEDLGADLGVYFAAAAIAKESQGFGIYGALNDRRLDFVMESGLDLIFTRTQNPRVEEGITRAVERLLVTDKIKSYKVGHHVLRGFYGTMLTSERPVARVINYDTIDYERGDANLITWWLSS